MSSVKHKTPLKQSFSSCVENLHYLACFAQLLLDGRSACQGRTPHPAACPLCDQEEESIQHLLLSSVFAQQVWFIIFQWLGLAAMCQGPGRLGLEALGFSVRSLNPVMEVPGFLPGYHSRGEIKNREREIRR